MYWSIADQLDFTNDLPIVSAIIGERSRKPCTIHNHTSLRSMKQLKMFKSLLVLLPFVFVFVFCLLLFI